VAVGQIKQNDGPFLSKFGIAVRRWNSTYPTHQVVGMPSLSPTMEKGSIASWNVKEGQSFSAGDVLCEVETDKATVSFEAQDDGVVAKILSEAGPNEVQCGEPILIVVEDAADVDAFKEYTIQAGVATPSSDPRETKSVAPITAPAPPSPPTVNSPPPTSTGTPSPASTGGRVVASPLAWTLAKEKGLNLSSVAIIGTGPDGRIIANDVREYIPLAASAPKTTAATATASSAAPTPAPTQSPVTYDNYTDYPLTQSSKDAAQLLSLSKQTVPHYYLTVDVTLDAILTLRSKLNASINSKSSKDDNSSSITLNDMLLKAAAHAMKSCPSANASWRGDVVRQYHSVDINFIMGQANSLYAPCIQNVDTRGIKSLSDELTSHLKSIQEGDSLSLAHMNNTVGTVTIMNLGMYGIKSCAPIIRTPQAVALALGAAEYRIVPKENANEGDDSDIYDTKVMLTATLSCDHRVVDGAVGAQWLSAFKSAVENPEILLL
jgi:pyruvate dehydrogenase E2 component (dihydrolipoamide acetyltransferase)